MHRTASSEAEPLPRTPRTSMVYRASPNEQSLRDLIATKAQELEALIQQYQIQGAARTDLGMAVDHIRRAARGVGESTDQ